MGGSRARVCQCRTHHFVVLVEERERVQNRETQDKLRMKTERVGPTTTTPINPRHI